VRASLPAHPGAPGIVGAARHRAQSAARSRELAPACQLATDLSPGSRHRLTCRMKKNASEQPGWGKAQSAGMQSVGIAICFRT
jgi:hypothetical protein